MRKRRGFNTPVAALRSTGGAFTSRITPAPSAGQANRLLYAFELCRQVWRHSQSPAVPLSESAFSSGEEPSSFVVTCTRGFMPLCAAAGIEPVRLNALSLPMDKSRGFPRDLVTCLDVTW